jgi:mRNA interferase HigB
MRIIAKRRLRTWQADYIAAAEALATWYDFVERADWKNGTDVLKDFSSASILPDNRVVFNLKGNRYRLIVRIEYRRREVYLRYFGTHTEYDKIDAVTI